MEKDVRRQAEQPIEVLRQAGARDRRAPRRGAGRHGQPRRHRIDLLRDLLRRALGRPFPHHRRGERRDPQAIGRVEVTACTGDDDLERDLRQPPILEHDEVQAVREDPPPRDAGASLEGSRSRLAPCLWAEARAPSATRRTRAREPRRSGTSHASFRAVGFLRLFRHGRHDAADFGAKVLPGDALDVRCRHRGDLVEPRVDLDPACRRRRCTPRAARRDRTSCPASRRSCAARRFAPCRAPTPQSRSS